MKDLEPAVTVVMVTSPTASDPALDTIDRTLRSVRAFDELAGCRVIIGCDGIRPEQRATLGAAYASKLGALVEYARLNQVEVGRLAGWGHQANVVRAILEKVTTDLILFMEHDTPLLGAPIDWTGCVRALTALDWTEPALHSIRFHHESQVLPDHAHLMIDTQPWPAVDVPVLRTAQWSQRPHLARTDWYRQLIGAYFAPSSRTMVEDVMHGVCDYWWRTARTFGWHQHRLALYADPDPTLQRSDHLDGRAGDRKYPCCFAYPHDTPPGAPAPTRLRYD